MAIGRLLRCMAPLALTAAVAASAGPARADNPPSADAAARARAAALKKNGDAAMDALRYEDAIAAYTEAYGASADPALLNNRGRVYQARSEYPQALADMERFAREAILGVDPAQDEILGGVEERAKLRMAALTLSPRHLVMLDAYIDGATLEEVGVRFGLTRERVRQLLVAVVERMRRDLAKRRDTTTKPIPVPPDACRGRGRYQRKLRAAEPPPVVAPGDCCAGTYVHAPEPEAKPAVARDAQGEARRMTLPRPRNGASPRPCPEKLKVRSSPLTARSTRA